jgi:Protein of unknown function (DUF433)
VSLDSIVYAFLDGDSPETIAHSFPVLTLEQVYGAIAYYLAHREEIDAHLRLEEADFEEKRRLARARNPQLHQRFQEIRRLKTLLPANESTLPSRRRPESEDRRRDHQA